MSNRDALFGATRLPRAILFGRNQRRAIGAVSARKGKRALLVTDARQAGQPEFRTMLEDLAASGVESRVFDGGIANLPTTTIDECVRQARAFQPDLLIAVGGGSSMDLAKVSAVLLAHGGTASAYYGEFAVPGPILPLIAVPTTSGTGSEVTPVAVVADEALGRKVGISSPYLIPEVAICDPDLTASCPPELTAVSGADALTHAIESFTIIRRDSDPLLTEKHVFVGKNVLSDHFARLAVANLFRYLERAYRNGSDMEAREGVMLAALAAGCSFGTAGTAAAHALQYPLGNLTHTAHGAGVAALLPYVMQFNRPSCRESFAELATLVGLPDGSFDERSQAFIEAVARLLAAINIPRSLAEMGLAEDQRDYVAEHALDAARLVKNNPRPLDLAATRAITNAAFAGDRQQLVHF